MLAETISVGNPAFTNADTLSEMGIEPHESKRWQKLARIPRHDFEAYIRNRAPIPFANPPSNRL